MSQIPGGVGRNIIPIKDKQSNQIQFRTIGNRTGVEWASCKPPIRYPIPPDLTGGGGHPHGAVDDGTPGYPKPPKPPAIKYPVFFIMFKDKSFYATIQYDPQHTTGAAIEKIIAEGRSLFGISINTGIWMSFKQPCKRGWSYS